MAAAFLNCADATADGWRRRRIRSQPERRRGTSVEARQGYGPGPARGGRRRSWYGSKKSITLHALKVQAAVLLHLIEPNRQKISLYHPMDPPPPSFSDGVRSEATSDCESGRPRMSIDLAPVCLPFVFGLCRPCSEHIGRSMRAAPALCPSSCGSMLRTMAELFLASQSLASGIRRGCRTDARASRQIVCGHIGWLSRRRSPHVDIVIARILTRPLVGLEPAIDPISGQPKWLCHNRFSGFWPQTPPRRCVMCADNESPHPPTRRGTVRDTSHPLSRVVTHGEKEGDDGDTIHRSNHLTKLTTSPASASRYRDDRRSGTSRLRRLSSPTMIAA